MKVENLNDFMITTTFLLEEKEDILEMAEMAKAKYILIVCNGLNYDDYFVFVGDGKDYMEIAYEYEHKPMQKVMGVYCIK